MQEPANLVLSIENVMLAAVGLPPVLFLFDDHASVASPPGNRLQVGFSTYLK